MISVLTNQPLHVKGMDGGGGEIKVAPQQVDALRRLLESRNVRHWPVESIFSFDGGPEFTFIGLSRNEDPATVQAILDSVP